MIITLDDAKQHMNVLDDVDDALITSKIKAAEGHVGSYVDCSMEPDLAPEPVKEAVRMLTAYLYENREAAIVDANVSVQRLPIGVLDLVGPYRRWVF